MPSICATRPTPLATGSHVDDTVKFHWRLLHAFEQEPKGRFSGTFCSTARLTKLRTAVSDPMVLVSQEPGERFIYGFNNATEASLRKLAARDDVHWIH